MFFFDNGHCMLEYAGAMLRLITSMTLLAVKKKFKFKIVCSALLP